MQDKQVIFYRVITYRSRKLAKNIIVLNETTAGGSAVISGYESDRTDDMYFDDLEEKRLTRKERRHQKKELKKAQKRSKKVVAIGDSEINTEDYDPEEIDDFWAAEQFNKDGFYDILEPIDASEVKKKPKADIKDKLIILVPAALTVLGIVVFSIYMMLTR